METLVRICINSLCKGEMGDISVRKKMVLIKFGMIEKQLKPRDGKFLMSSERNLILDDFLLDKIIPYRNTLK